MEHARSRTERNVVDPGTQAGIQVPVLDLRSIVMRAVLLTQSDVLLCDELQLAKTSTSRGRITLEQ
jgi:hypothetical protein